MALLSTSFPWRTGNQFQLHVDGESFYPKMLHAIQNAQRTICMEMYLCNSGKVFSEFRDALIAAAQRGVSVQLSLDDFGSLQLNNHDRVQLANADIAVRFYNPIRWRRGFRNLLRNHRKALIVDDCIAFTGGAGLTDEFRYDSDREPAWHDVMLEMHGPVVTDWQYLFEKTWDGLPTQRRHSLPIQQPISAADGLQGSGRVVTAFGPQAHHVLQSLYRRIKAADRRVWVVTPYFVPSWQLRHRLINAARRGVDTRILVPGIHTDHPSIQQASRRYYANLLKHGVRIFEYRPRFIHMKIALCDDWVTIGSTNFDRWSVRWNLDANQEVADINFVTQMVGKLDLDFSQSIELQQHDWLRRPWHQRCTEWVTGLLERLSGRLK